MRTKILAILLLTLAACGGKPTLPDPTVQYPKPPAALMEPGANLQTIPEN